MPMTAMRRVRMTSFHPTAYGMRGGDSRSGARVYGIRRPGLQTRGPHLGPDARRSARSRGRAPANPVTSGGEYAIAAGRRIEVIATYRNRQAEREHPHEIHQIGRAH